jgi:hypothetical protein
MNTLSETQEQERAANVEKLKAAIKFGAELQDEYDRSAPGVKQGQRDRIALLLQVHSVRLDLEARAKPLDELTFPSAFQINKQRDEVAMLTAKLTGLLDLLADAERRCEPLLECVRLQNAIVNQRFAVRNLRTLVAGGRPGFLEGGLSTSVDFIGNTQMPPR